jgi:glycine betaine/choline ABC-type transport system substrate-binding protein
VLPAALAVLALSFGVGACGGNDSNTTSDSSETTKEEGSIVFNPENQKTPTLTIGSKNFPEQEILGEIYAQALTAAGYKVKTALNLGSETVAWKALKNGQISGYPEYASTALTSLFGFRPDEVPSNPEAAREKANAQFVKKNFWTFKPTPFASANAVGTTKAIAEKYGLKTISDLKGVSRKLSLYGSPECRQRIDCLAGLEKLYGLRFKSFTPVDIGLRYSVLEKGPADLSILFTTDPQLAAESDKFVVLKDDKHVFPPGNVIFVYGRNTAWSAGSGFEQTIQFVEEGLTLKVMQELNARVELEKETPQEAAQAYLESGGYIAKQQ